LVRNNQDYSNYPRSIKELCREITDTDRKEELWMYLEKDFGKTIMTNDKNIVSKPNDRQVFISYSWGGESESFADKLDEISQNKGITIIRDKRDIGFKGIIKTFMEKIGKGKVIIIVIDEKYLKSKNCMFELVQIDKNGSFHERVFPIILDDAHIYDPILRITYVQHWEKKSQILNKQ
jgi:hypothetical protein